VLAAGAGLGMLVLSVAVAVLVHLDKEIQVVAVHQEFHQFLLKLVEEAVVDKQPLVLAVLILMAVLVALDLIGSH